MIWQEISVSVLPGAADELAERFYLIGCGGVVFEDPEVAAGYIRRGEWDVCERPAELPPSGEIVVKGYVPFNQEWPEKWKRFSGFLEDLPPGSVRRVSLRKVAEEDWANAWKAYYKPEKVGQRLVVCPSWEQYDPGQDEIVLRLDPGMAFGTGTHATTALCLQALEQFVPGRQRVADVGTGSGILALAAAKLGAAEVVAVDNDPVAVKVACANVRENGLVGRVKVMEGDLDRGLTGPFDLVVANIIADVIKKLAVRVPGLLGPGGIFLASGVITERRDDVCRSLRETGLTVQEIRQEGNWLLLVAGLEEKKDAQVQD